MKDAKQTPQIEKFMTEFLGNINGILVEMKKLRVMSLKEYEAYLKCDF